MSVSQLSLFDFRNYEKRSFDFSENLVVLFGPNGRGKTNVLEALSVLSVGKSWRETQSIDLIREGCESALIKAKTQDQNLYTVKIQPSSRIFEINEKKMPLHRYFGKIPTLLFVPEHLQLFSDPKRSRQRFFDRFLIQIEPSYRDTLIHFDKAVRHKNALLRNFDLSLFSKKHLEDQIVPWNEVLVETIPEIIRVRTSFLDRLSPLLEHELSALSGNIVPLRMELAIAESYVPTRNGVRYFFDEYIGREIAARKCLIGAHRDDFSFFFREKPLLSTASRGETRSILLALLSAQKSILESSLGTLPILLLDDVFSELDQTRQNYLHQLCHGSQAFFTTTHEIHFEHFEEKVEKFEILT